jgi:hypothetical protein
LLQKYFVNFVEIFHNFAVFSRVSFQFGVAMMLSGVIGVPVGSLASQKLRLFSLRADPLICAVGLAISAPTLWGASMLSTHYTWTTLILIFIGMMSLNLSWCIVADILLVNHKTMHFC